MVYTERFEHWLWFLLIGLFAGWVAGLLMKGRGFGVLGDIIVGILGAVFGGWLFGVLGLYTYSSIGAFLMALFGAVSLLALIGVVKRA